MDQSRKILKPRMKILVEEELKTQFQFGAGSFTSQMNMVFPTGYLKMLFPFIYYFLLMWTEKKYQNKKVFNELKCLSLVHPIFKNLRAKSA